MKKSIILLLVSVFLIVSCDLNMNVSGPIETKPQEDIFPIKYDNGLPTCMEVNAGAWQSGLMGSSYIAYSFINPQKYSEVVIRHKFDNGKLYFRCQTNSNLTLDVFRNNGKEKIYTQNLINGNNIVEFGTDFTMESLSLRFRNNSFIMNSYILADVIESKISNISYKVIDSGLMFSCMTPGVTYKYSNDSGSTWNEITGSFIDFSSLGNYVMFKATKTRRVDSNITTYGTPPGV